MWKTNLKITLQFAKILIPYLSIKSKEENIFIKQNV